MCYFFSDQEPPSSLLKLNMIADKEKGWLLVGALMFPLFSFCTYLSFQYGYVCMCVCVQVVKCLVEAVPDEDPLGPAVITLFLDESPLPTRVSAKHSFCSST